MPDTETSKPADARALADIRKLADAVLLGLLALAVLTVALPFLSPLRGAVVFAAILLVPGGAALTFFDIERPSTYLALAVVLSLSIATLTSLVMVWLNLWHPLVLAAILAIGSAALLGKDLSRRLHPPAPSHPSTEARA